MREADIEEYLVKQVKAKGGQIRKVKWVGRRSAPDRVIMLPADSVFEQDILIYHRFSKAIWVEVKRPGKKATFPSDARERAQEREHRLMRQMGQTVVIVDSKEDVDELLG